MARSGVERSFSEPNLQLTCRCGWEGHDDDVEDWTVEPARDRAVRQCPGCDEGVPEWGVIRPISAASLIARGPLRESLIDAGHLSE